MGQVSACAIVNVCQCAVKEKERAVARAFTRFVPSLFNQSIRGAPRRASFSLLRRNRDRSFRLFAGKVFTTATRVHHAYTCAIYTRRNARQTAAGCCCCTCRNESCRKIVKKFPYNEESRVCRRLKRSATNLFVCIFTKKVEEEVEKEGGGGRRRKKRRRKTTSTREKERKREIRLG